MPGSPPVAGQAPGERVTRIPSLDGLRAVSIGFVILSHAVLAPGTPPALLHTAERLGLGNLGVRVFFVISGFLITGILLGEHRRTGTIRLRRFYLRRAFRIFPPFYVYLAAVLLLGAVGAIAPLPPLAALRAATYTFNYPGVPEGAWTVSHFWSLALEEQFYLLWPPLLAWLGLRAGFRVAATFVLLAPLIRLAIYAAAPWAAPYIGTTFETGADAILVGCLLAGWREALWARAWYRRLLTSRWLVLVPLVVLGAAALLDRRPRLSYLVGIPVKNLGIAVLVDWAVRSPAGRVGRLLNARPVAYVGVLSYSLYIWQQLFLVGAHRSPLLRVPLSILWTAAAAVASYYAIERPALRLRARIERQGRASTRVVPGDAA